MKQSSLLGILLVFAAVWLWGCEHDTSNGPTDDDITLTDKTCLGCHSSESELKLALGDKATAKEVIPCKGDG